ncbi:M48 family metallopeptidase [Candidatus Saccharibacteria bacterium]|nr:M48 family metallopeptidase [Candidatus Saccharibacteria bacterium]
MIIKDSEFGEIIIRKSALSHSVKFSVSTSGRLQMSVPKYATNFLIKRFLNSSRKQIRENLKLKDPSTQRARDAKKKILMKKAKEYLPYRLNYYAKLYGYTYDNFRVSHASTRWGSCTRHGKTGSTTISLNIGLMQVPEPLRDYVIIHELAHLNHMDHSSAFWEEVGSHDPKYKLHRKRLKMFNPGV